MKTFEPNRIRYTSWYLLYYAVVWYVSYIGFQVLSGDEVDLAFLLRTSLVWLFVVFFWDICVASKREIYGNCGLKWNHQWPYCVG